MKDKLSYLTDLQITQFIRDSPTKLKRRLVKILVQLDKHEITLDDNGKIDWGTAPDHLVKKL